MLQGLFTTDTGQAIMPGAHNQPADERTTKATYLSHGCLVAQPVRAAAEPVVVLDELRVAHRGNDRVLIVNEAVGNGADGAGVDGINARHELGLRQPPAVDQQLTADGLGHLVRRVLRLTEQGAALASVVEESWGLMAANLVGETCYHQFCTLKQR